jgi:ribonuclease HI
MSQSQTEPEPEVTIYTDGACDPNPGPGGWGAVLFYYKSGELIERALSGGDPDTTNNRMELTAAIEALHALKRPYRVHLRTDSEYLRMGITEWMPRWLATDWRKGKIKNQDLWQELNALVGEHEVTWEWVKGHAGDVYNERVDLLARAAIPRPKSTPLADAAQVYIHASSPGGSGPGGWAAKICKGGEETILRGRHPSTGLNGLYLLAAIAGLECLPQGANVQVFTTSDYLYNGITKWIHDWEKRNWRTRDGGQVKYRGLWQRLDQLCQARQVKWVHVSHEPPEELESLQPIALGEATRAADG